MAVADEWLSTTEPGLQTGSRPFSLFNLQVFWCACDPGLFPGALARKQPGDLLRINSRPFEKKGQASCLDDTGTAFL